MSRFSHAYPGDFEDRLEGIGSAPDPSLRGRQTTCLRGSGDIRRCICPACLDREQATTRAAIDRIRRLRGMAPR